MLTLRNVMRLHAVVAILCMIPMLFFPGPFLALLAAEPVGPMALTLLRMFGALFIAIAVAEWGTAQLDAEAPHRLVAWGTFAYLCVGFVVSLLSQLDGVWNALGWANAIFYALFAGLFAYCLLRRPALAVQV